MNPYNGYSGSQRLKALAWIKKQYALGAKPPKPTCCHVCGQKEGNLAWHSEDYSAPFGDNIGRFGLCYICHMMIHCRYKNKKAWQNYKSYIKNGLSFKPYHFNDWNSFRKDFLIDLCLKREYEKNPNTNVEILNLIEKGVYKDEGSEEYKALIGSPLAL